MQVHHKPQLDKASLLAFLEKHWAAPITALETLVEGEDSQALYFDSEGKRYVLRINKSDYGFRKDAYAYEHFASESIPIPKVFQIGKIDSDYTFCISEFIEGSTLQELDRTAITALLPATLAMQRMIAAVDISNTIGYGEFDLTGNGKSASWQEWLLTHITKPDFDWDDVVARSLIDRAFLDKVFVTFKRLVDQVPNERQLIHGDFGANNILARDNKIVAVLDLDAAGYGDWLFDVAGAYYWRENLGDPFPCMELSSEYYEQELNQLLNYRERIACYQLRGGLIEMYVQANRGEHEKLGWHMKRCRQIVETI